MSENWLNILGVLGTIVAIAGFIYAVIVARRSEYRKILTYDLAPPVALASVIPNRTEYRLSIVYRRRGAEPVNVDGVYLRFVQIGNLGKDPIRRDDIAPSDPLRLEIRSSTVLDIAVANVSRDVINFELSLLEKAKDGVVTSYLSFDFLDYKDGAVIRVVTDDPRTRIGVSGTIIGMPEGIYRKDDLGRYPVLDKVGCGLGIALQMATVAGALYLFRIVTGGWALLWLYLIPIAALILPALLVALVASTVWPTGPAWPKTLALPEWLISRYMRDEEYRRHYHYRLEEELVAPEKRQGPPDRFGAGGRRGRKPIDRVDESGRDIGDL